jgi:flagellar protein FliS
VAELRFFARKPQDLPQSGEWLNVSYQLASYQRSQVQSASSEEILVLLFKTAVVRARTAMKNCENSQDTVRGEAVRKLLDIVIELRSTLDRNVGGEVAANLDQLYDFVITTVIEAHTERDSEKFQQALSVLDVLRDAFSQAAKQIKDDPESYEAAKADAEQKREEARAETAKAEAAEESKKVATLSARSISEEKPAQVTPPPAKRARSVAVKRYSAY